MRIPEEWGELMANLQCLTSQSAKRQFRHSIRYAWGGMCCFCREDRATTVDHLKPRSRGGSDLRSNLVPCCHSCNQDKGSQDWVEWFQKQDFHSEVAEQLIHEWVENRHVLESESSEVKYRAKVCTVESTIRSRQNEPSRTGEDCLAAA